MEKEKQRVEALKQKMEQKKLAKLEKGKSKAAVRSAEEESEESPEEDDSSGNGDDNQVNKGG